MDMKTYLINALVPISFTVEAESEMDAVQMATTLKKYSITSPNGERVDIEEEHIQSIERA